MQICLFDEDIEPVPPANLETWEVLWLSDPQAGISPASCGDRVVMCPLEQIWSLIPEPKVGFKSRGKLTAIRQYQFKQRWLSALDILPGIAYRDAREARQIYAQWRSIVSMIEPRISITSRPQTIPAIAAEIVRLTLIQAPVWRPRGQKARPIQAAHIGHRSEIYTWKGGGPLIEIDLVSAYPSRARLPLPAGEPIWLGLKRQAPPGWICLCQADIPRQTGHIGLLPHLSETHGTAFPVYPWTSWFWSRELEMAGIGQIRQRLAFPANDFLAPIMHRIMIERGKHGSLDRLLKGLALCMIGVFAQTGQSERIQSCLPRQAQPGHAYDPDLQVEIRISKPRYSPPWACPQVANYIWSLVRAEVYQAILDQPYNAVQQSHVDGLICLPWHVAPRPGWALKNRYQDAYWESLYSGHLSGHKVPGGRPPAGPAFRNRIWSPIGCTYPIEDPRQKTPWMESEL